MTTPAHHLVADDALRLIDSSFEHGLTSDEAARRLEKFGTNQVKARGGTPTWLRFVRQFTASLVLVLIAAAVVTGILGEWVDAAVILIVVAVNAVVGFLQESKAETALEALMRWSWPRPWCVGMAGKSRSTVSNSCLATS